MRRYRKMFAFAGALTLIVASLTFSFRIPRPAEYGIALLICLVSWWMYGRKSGLPGYTMKFSKDMPDPNTRAYARAMFHNGLISIEELDRFYATHPEKEDGAGS